MTEKGISSKLWALSEKISEKANEYKNKGSIIKRRRLYIKAKVTNFDYKDGSIEFGRSFDKIERKEWDLIALSHFINTVIKEFSEYQEVVSQISNKLKVNRIQVDFWLLEFVQKLTYRILEGVTDEILRDYITAFINDLEEVPVEWKVKIWIQGIWPEDNDYEIYGGLKIRRTRPSDFEEETPLVGGFQFPLGFERIPPTILELTFRAKEQREIWDEIEMILNCLRLFRLGSIFSIRWEMEPKSILRVGGKVTNWPISTSIYRYCINREDIPKLKDLIDKVKILLPKKYLQGVLPRGDPALFSLQRYSAALLKQEGVESGITSAITCLEALYLKAEERMELSRRLSQRTSALLRLFDFKPLKVYSTVKRAYNIRSIFIHGSQIKPVEHESAVRLLERVLDYARVSVLVFLQVKGFIDKDELINQIDGSLLDAKVYSRLEKFIKEKCKFCPLRW